MEHIKVVVNNYLSSWRYCNKCEVAVKEMVQCNCRHTNKDK